MAGQQQIAVDDGMMVLAVRYAIGRATYVTGWTCLNVKRSWSSMSARTRRTIYNDVSRALTVTVDLTGTSLPDEDEWQGLLDFMKAHPEG